MQLVPDDLPVTFLPVQRIGVSAEHLSFPARCRFRPTTAIAAWTELGESLARAGVRKLVLVTSHGGNVAAMEMVARDLRVRLGMLAVTVGWHRFGYPDGTFGGEEKRHGIHGGDIETSLMLAAQPATVRMEQGAECRAGDHRHGARVQVARRLSAGRLCLDDPGPPSDRRARRCHAGDAPQRAKRRWRTAPRRSWNCCARSTASIWRGCATGPCRARTTIERHFAFAGRRYDRHRPNFRLS